MENTNMEQMWSKQNEMLQEVITVNKQLTLDMTRMKVKLGLDKMKPIKAFTLIVGIIWVFLMDTVLIYTFPFSSWFFFISMGLQSLLTKFAIGVYLYQWITISKVNVNDSVASVQECIAKLQSSTLWVTRILFLQLPLWTTFYINSSMLENGSTLLSFIQIVITLLFLIAAIWLFVNIDLKNKNKKWFQFMFSDVEWLPILKAQEMLAQIREYK